MLIRSTTSAPPKPVNGKKRGRKRTITVRVLQLPDPVYTATNFTNMIDWESSQMTEPPILRDLTNDQILAFQDCPSTCKEPSNSQFVERNIQMIAKQGIRAASSTLRQGLSHATGLVQTGLDDQEQLQKLPLPSERYARQKII